MAPRVPNVLMRLKARIKHGVEQPSAAYEALRRHPPPPWPILRKPLGEIVLATDVLETRYRQRMAAERGASPTVPLHDPRADPAVAFAARQHALMVDGLDEAGAAAAADAAVVAARAEAAAFARALADGDAPFPERAAAARAAYAADAEPWAARSEEKKLELDAWLVAEVLQWDWELARCYGEEAAARSVVLDAPPGAFPLADAVGALRDRVLGATASSAAVGGDLVLPSDAVPADAWSKTYDALAARAERRALDEWTAEEVAELDEWLEKVRVDVAGGEPVVHDDPRMVKRLEVFPELGPDYERRPSLLEPVAANADEDAERDGDANAAAPPTRTPQTPTLTVRTVVDPADVAKTLAAHGLYPSLTPEEVDKMLDDGVSEKNKHVVANVREELASPDSYAAQRASAAQRAHAEQAFLDRVGNAPRADDA